MRSVIEGRLVEAARTYHEQSRKADSATWDLADAILAFSAEEGRYWMDATREVLKGLSLPVFSDTHLKRFRATAEVWAQETRVDGASFRAHAELDPSYRDEMVAHVEEHGRLTLNDASEMKGAHVPSRGIVAREPSTQEKAEQVRQHIQDEEVATVLAADPKVRSSFSRAADEVDRENRDRSEDRQRRESPSVYAFEKTSKVDNLLAKIERQADDAASLIDTLVNEGLIKDAERDRWIAQLDRQAARIDFMKSKLSGESIDEELRALLGGAA